MVEGQELTRAERRELKKKQAERANKSGADGDGDEGDDLMVNPNHLTKKLNISDLSAPRELTRRERYVPVTVSHTLALFVLNTPPFILYFVHREQKEKKEAKERYWKVNALVRSLVDFFCLDLILIFCVYLCPALGPLTALAHFTSCMPRARPTKLRPTCPASQRSVRSARPRLRRGKPKPKVSVPNWSGSYTSHSVFSFVEKVKALAAAKAAQSKR